MTYTVWYHDPAEVDPRSAWTGLTPSLAAATYADITTCTESHVTELFGYARPDAVIDNDGIPVVSIEQTMMNPSGHNMPQRFACLLRATEAGVPSVLYHPRLSRRTFSDPGVRYVNPRVALAQLHSRDVFPYSSPSLSVYWPVDGTNLPDRSQGAQQNLADVIEAFCRFSGASTALWQDDAVGTALDEMQDVVDEYGVRIRENASFRQFFPDGLPHALTSTGHSVDPPPTAGFADTAALINDIRSEYVCTTRGEAVFDELRERDISLVFKTTANRARNDSEHPWPGYFALLDVLYARTGPAVSERRLNMIYALPIPINTWLSRIDSAPTSMVIVDALADVIMLQGGAVAGRGRGLTDAQRRLTA
jgi:hypothetical protein